MNDRDARAIRGLPMLHRPAESLSIGPEAVYVSRQWTAPRMDRP